MHCEVNVRFVSKCTNERISNIGQYMTYNIDLLYISPFCITDNVKHGVPRKLKNSFMFRTIIILKSTKNVSNLSILLPHASIQWLTRCKNVDDKYCESDNQLCKYLHLNKT